MERICASFNNEAVQFAHASIPESILNHLHFDYLIGCDPIWSGLFKYEETKDGRSYHTLTCVAYPYHQSLPKDKQKTTIVLPKRIGPVSIIHEIGHVLDEFLGFEHEALPVTSYAKTNKSEAFAEAFAGWLIKGYSRLRVDPKTIALFEALV